MMMTRMTWVDVIKYFVSTLLVMGVSLLSSCGLQADKPIADVTRERVQSVENKYTKENNETKEVPEDITITISAAGDCTLGTDPILEQYNYPTFMDEYEKQNKNTAYFLEKVQPIFEKDDLTIVNLETTLTAATKKASKKYRFKGLPEFSQILVDGHVEAVSLANNHSRDYLQKGYDDTKLNLKNKGIGYFGYKETWTTTIKGVKIGLIGHTGWEASKKAKELIKSQIETLKAEGCQLVIVSFHWGSEYTFYPNATQKQLAHYAIDQGADLILGHHPHVMQGIERYKDKHIVYSLGNFCFGGNLNPKDKDTFIYQETFTFSQGKEGYNTVVKIIPCSVSSRDDRNDFQPYPLQGEGYTRIIERINKYSKKLNFNYPGH